MPAIEFQDPARNIVQEVPVVRDCDDSAFVLLDMMLEPCDGFRIEMVGWLIEKQDVWFPQQKPAKRHAALLAAGKHANQSLGRRAAQRIHGHFETRVQVPRLSSVQLLLNFPLAIEKVRHFVAGHRLGEFPVDFIEFAQKINDRLHALFDNLADSLRRIKLRLLLEETDSESGRNRSLALKLLIHSRKYPQKRTLTGAIQSDDADLRPVEIRKIDIFEDSFLVVVFAYSNHGVDDFVRDCAHDGGNSAI